MEVVVTDSDGLQDDFIISIRSGTTRRQAPLDTARTRALKFPSTLESCCEPLKIDVLQTIASTRLVLHPREAAYKVRLDGDDRQGPLGLALQVTDSDGCRHKGLAAEKLVTRPETPLKHHETAASAREYLESQGLLKYIQSLLHAVIQVRPKDPYKFMMTQLSAAEPLPPAPKDQSARDTLAGTFDALMRGECPRLSPSPEPRGDCPDPIPSPTRPTEPPVPPPGTPPPLPRLELTDEEEANVALAYSAPISNLVDVCTAESVPMREDTINGLSQEVHLLDEAVSNSKLERALTPPMSPDNTELRSRAQQLLLASVTAPDEFETQARSGLSIAAASGSPERGFKEETPTASSQHQETASKEDQPKPVTNYSHVPAAPAAECLLNIDEVRQRVRQMFEQAVIEGQLERAMAETLSPDTAELRPAAEEELKAQARSCLLSAAASGSLRGALEETLEKEGSHNLEEAVLPELEAPAVPTVHSSPVEVPPLEAAHDHPDGVVMHHLCGEVSLLKQDNAVLHKKVTDMAKVMEELRLENERLSREAGLVPRPI